MYRVFLGLTAWIYMYFNLCVCVCVHADIHISNFAKTKLHLLEIYK